MQIAADRPAQTSAPPATARGAIGADFQTFLRMLTTQMQNQDPLNPMEATDFAVQLATFAQVEQQTRSNQLLESMTTRLGLSALAQMAGWIGMEARVPGPVWFDGAPVTLAAERPAGADAAVLVVRNAAGQEVAREALPEGGGTFDWAGIDPGGTPLPAGRYSFAVEGYSRSTLVGEGQVRAFAPVTEARVTPAGGVEIVLRGGIALDAQAVDGLRRPGG